MLILSRKAGESFMIGTDIEVKVTEIVGDKVKIGIDAPDNVKVYRKELRQTVESNREAAAKTISKDLLKFLESSLDAEKETPKPSAPKEEPSDRK